MAIMRNSWELEESKHFHYLQEGQEEELQDDQPYLNPWRDDEATNLGKQFQT